MTTLPIPEVGSGASYSALLSPRGNLFELMTELQITRYREDGRWVPLTPSSEAHLDPDLSLGSRIRHSDWRPVFGQSGSAQGVLANRGVCRGDLFIFYGTFRHTQELNATVRFIGPPFHAIFGYMLIGNVIRVDDSTDVPWCADHPHLLNRNRKSNTLYLAADDFVHDNRKIQGAGILQYTQQRVLSSSTDQMSMWRMPRFFHPSVSGKIMSSNRPSAWTLLDDQALVRTKSPGQEYVIEATEEMKDWAIATLAI